MSNLPARISPRQFNGSAADKALFALVALGPSVVVALVVSFPLGVMLTLWPIGVALCGLRGAQLMRRTWKRRIVDAPDWMTDEYRRRSDGGQLALVEHHGAVALIAGRGDDQVAIVSRGYVRELDRAERDALWVRLAYDAADRAHRRQRASAIADPLGSLCRAFVPNLTWLHRAVAVVSSPWNALVRRVVNDQVALRHGDVASVAGDSAQVAALASAYRRGMGVQMRLPSGGFAIVGERVFLGERAMHLEVIAGNRQHIHGPVHGAMADSPLVANTEFEIVDLTNAPDTADDAASDGDLGDLGDLGDDFDHLLADLDIAPSAPHRSPDTEGDSPRGTATEDLPTQGLPTGPEGAKAEAAPHPPAAAPSVIDVCFDDAPDADIPAAAGAPQPRRNRLSRLFRRRRAPQNQVPDREVDGETNHAFTVLSEGPEAPAASAGHPGDDLTAPRPPDGAPIASALDEAPQTPPPCAGRAVPAEGDTEAAAETELLPERVAPAAAAPPTAPRLPVLSPPEPPANPEPVEHPHQIEPPAIIGAPEPVEWTQKVRPWTELQAQRPAPQRSTLGHVSWDEDDNDSQPDAYRDPLGALLRRRRRQHSRDGD